ncbi:MAG: VWA domain-containing protein [Parvibaculaceae bacterium]
MNLETRGHGGPSGKLAENIMHFARILRKAGLPVGPGAVLDALEATQGGVLRTRDDFYWALHAIFVKRHEHEVLYEQAFKAFWRKPKMFEQLMQMLFQQIRVEGAPRQKQAAQRRLANAMFEPGDASSTRERPGAVEIDASLTASVDEVLRTRDFEQMTVEEEARAKAAIARMRLHRIELPMRRFEGSPKGGRIDMRRTLSRSLRTGGEIIPLAWRKRRRHEPPLVVLADISGSMSNYSRMFLHFLHAVTNDRDRVQVFLFGTRLTNVTREIQRRDVDEALAKVSAAVKDWSGGTRIGRCLREFNFRWGRRVLTQNAHVLLMTDGLEREDCELLGAEMQRLKRSARRIVWLNPLLRFQGFEAKASGIRAIMPYVDEFRPVHSLDNLEDLARALAGPPDARHDPKAWMEKAA